MTEATGDNMFSRDQLKQLLARARQNGPVEETSVDAVDYDWSVPHHFGPIQQKKLKQFTEEMAIDLSGQFTEICGEQLTVNVSETTEHFAGSVIKEYTNDKDTSYLTFGETGKVPIGVLAMPKRTSIHWAAKVLHDTPPENVENCEMSQLEKSMLSDIASATVGTFSECCVKNGLSFFKAAESLTKEDWPLELSDFEELSRINFLVKDEKGETEASFIVISRVFDGLFVSTEGSATPPTETEVRDLIISHLNDIPIPVKAVLGKANIAVSDLMTVEVGDVLVLDKRIDSPIEVLIDDKMFFKGRPAKSMKKYAVAITATKASFNNS